MSEKCGGHSWFRTNNMPPDRYSSQDALDITMQALDAPGGLGTALSAIEAVCHRGDPDIAEMVALLNGHSHILEYIISGTLPPVSIGPYVLPVLTISPSSNERGSIRETLEVDSHRVPHAHNAEYDGYNEHATPPEVLIFIAIHRVSIRRQCATKPPSILEEGGTLVRCPEESRGERQQCFCRGEHFSG